MVEENRLRKPYFPGPADILAKPIMTGYSVVYAHSCNPDLKLFLNALDAKSSQPPPAQTHMFGSVVAEKRRIFLMPI